MMMAHADNIYTICVCLALVVILSRGTEPATTKLCTCTHAMSASAVTLHCLLFLPSHLQFAVHIQQQYHHHIDMCLEHETSTGIINCKCADVFTLTLDTHHSRSLDCHCMYTNSNSDHRQDSAYSDQSDVSSARLQRHGLDDHLRVAPHQLGHDVAANPVHNDRVRQTFSICHSIRHMR